MQEKMEVEKLQKKAQEQERSGKASGADPLPRIAHRL